MPRGAGAGRWTSGAPGAAPRAAPPRARCSRPGGAQHERTEAEATEGQQEPADHERQCDRQQDDHAALRERGQGEPLGAVRGGLEQREPQPEHARAAHVGHAPVDHPLPGHGEHADQREGGRHGPEHHGLTGTTAPTQAETVDAPDRRADVLTRTRSSHAVRVRVVAARSRTICRAQPDG